MSVFSKLFSKAGDIAETAGSKLLKKNGGDAKLINTATKAVPKEVAKTTSKGATTLAKNAPVVAGRLAGATAIVGATGLALGLGATKTYEYFKDVKAKTPAQSNLEDYLGSLKDYNKITGATGGTSSGTSGLPSIGGSTNSGTTVSDPGFPSYNDLASQNQATTDASTSNTKLIVYGALALAGLYIGYQMFKKKKK